MLATTLPAAVAPLRAVDPQDLADACGDDPGWWCEKAYEITGNSFVAELFDLVLGRLVTILLVLVAAFVVTRILYRVIDHFTRDLIAGEGITSRSIQRLQEEMPDVLVGAAEPPEVDRIRAQSRAATVSRVLRGVAAVTVWTIAVLISLGELNINLGPLIAGAGIAGVALGFGAQSLVKDCINGLFMLIEDQYGVGDVVDVGEATGVVESISLRSTTLRSVDGIVWHVPNGEIVRVGNLSKLWSVALVDVDVAYDTDLDFAQGVFLDAARRLCATERFADDVLEPPELLGVEMLGADGISLRLKVKVRPGTQWALQRALRRAVKEAFDAEGVVIPFPQRTLWIQPRPDAGTEPGGSGTGGAAESDPTDASS